MHTPTHQQQQLLSKKKKETESEKRHKNTKFLHKHVLKSKIKNQVKEIKNNYTKNKNKEIQLRLHRVNSKEHWLLSIRRENSKDISLLFLFFRENVKCIHRAHLIVYNFFYILYFSIDFVFIPLLIFLFLYFKEIF